LYDLAKDRSEQKNLAGAQPDKARQLSEKWKAIDDDFTRVREGAPACAKKLMPAGRAAAGAA
jgi:hypothetical protein